ncbi:unnamed protein product [Coffea canephora]|uniref:DH200=94 genomic scaffold, scaffold_1085 n=1 Tax=Coffea canephora TaxID=49390 RepID=A0A068VI69_COFCA|nr:unnamed protein product [Coffea canephora]
MVLNNLSITIEAGAVVALDPCLFAGTIHENIAYGAEGATEAEVAEAATLVNAHEFVRLFNADGYQTSCGERGVQLSISSGQKQRIAIARAMLKRPRFSCYMRQQVHWMLNQKIFFSWICSYSFVMFIFWL